MLHLQYDAPGPATNQVMACHGTVEHTTPLQEKFYFWKQET